MASSGTYRHSILPHTKYIYIKHTYDHIFKLSSPERFQTISRKISLSRVSPILIPSRSALSCIRKVICICTHQLKQSRHCVLLILSLVLPKKYIYIFVDDGYFCSVSLKHSTHFRTHPAPPTPAPPTPKKIKTNLNTIHKNPALSMCHAT